MLFERTKSGTLETEKALAEKIVRKAIEMFGREADWKDRTGAYCLFADKQTGEAHYIIHIGTINPMMMSRFFNNVHEKASRLASNPDHLSSAQSRNFDLGQFRGAIRTQRYIISISGLPEYGDEICSLRFALERQELSLNRAKMVTKISRNPYRRFLRVKL